MPYKIHRALTEDIGKIAELWLDFIQDPEGSDLNILPVEENKERWKKFAESIITKNKGAIKFATIEENVVGYVFYSWEDSPLKLYKNEGQYTTYS